MILRITQQYKYKFILCSLLGLANAGLTVWIIEILSSNPASTLPSDQTSWLVKFIGIIFTLLIGLNLNTYFTTKIGVDIRHQLRTFITKKVLSTSYEKITSVGGHKVYSKLTKDIEDISEFISCLPYYIQQILILICCIGFMAYTSLALFCIPFLMFTANLFLMSYLMKKDIAYHQDHRENIDHFNADIKTMVEGSKELSQSSCRNQSFYQHRAQSSIARMKGSDFKQAINSCLIDNWMIISTFIALSSVCLVHFFARIGRPEDVLTFTFLFLYIQSPVQVTTYAKEAFIKARVSIKSIEKLGLNSILDLSHHSKKLQLQPENAIIYKNLVYQYPKGKKAFSLKPINFELKQGEIVFLHGQNGSGKSTFSMLLTGLLSPQSGSISLGNQTIDSSNTRWKNLFGVVYTNSCLFQEVVDQDGKLVESERVENFLRFIKLDHKVKVKDGVLSTVDLSQGQKKRIALLLAYFENAPILVFDEFAADQDPSFRKYFYEHIIHELRAQGKTIFAITHDDTYFHHADRLFVMNQGKLSSDEAFVRA
jgi:cyclic peptide transporter